MTSITRSPNPSLPAFAGSSPNIPPPNWVEMLTPLFAEIDRQSRRAAREEYELLLAEKAKATAEADRNEQILTVAQTATLLGLRPQSVYEWVKSGKLTAYKAGRAVRLKRGDVLAALQAQTQPDGRRKYARKGTKQNGR